MVGSSALLACVCPCTRSARARGSKDAGAPATDFPLVLDVRRTMWWRKWQSELHTLVPAVVEDALRAANNRAHASYRRWVGGYVAVLHLVSSSNQPHPMCPTPTRCRLISCPHSFPLSRSPGTTRRAGSWAAGSPMSPLPMGDDDHVVMVPETPVGPDTDVDIGLQLDAFVGVQYLAEDRGVTGWILPGLKSQLVGDTCVQRGQLCRGDSCMCHQGGERGRVYRRSWGGGGRVGGW